MRPARPRPWTFVLVLLTAVLGLCAVEYTFHVGGPLTAFTADWVYNGAMLAAGGVCVARGAVRREQRAVWLLMGAAVCAWAVGNLVWTFAYGADPPYPSLADAGFLAFYPPSYVALVLLVRSRTGNSHGSLWLDGVIGGLATASVGTAVVFEAVLEATAGPPEVVATNLAYPLADLTLIALVVWAIGTTGWRPGRKWALIGTGLLVFSISDSLYLYGTAVGTYTNGSITDLGWLAGGVLIAWAAWQPAPARSARSVEGWQLLLAPAAFACLALAVLAYDHFERVTVLSLVLATMAIAAVIARMALSFVENAIMLAGSRVEARTDALTGLGNRRKLVDDLQAALVQPADGKALALFDLDGFKFYNDSFGHPAGDALLRRLAANLERTIAGRGRAYRIGGDEFCILADGPAGDLLVRAAADALGEHGEGFAISATYGSVVLVDEAETAAEALRLADRRMYASKHRGRTPPEEQSSGVLLQALAERYPELGHHVTEVAELAEDVALELGLRGPDVARARLAAALHDVGKMAIPDEILAKSDALTSDEWAFLRRHTLIGERILLAAPALAHVATLVRSTHERYDGRGYPDGLAGEAIPLASRIAFVCDAFDAMTSARPYGSALPAASAVAELRRHAGTQFDPDVVDAFVRALEAREPRAVPLAS